MRALKISYINYINACALLKKKWMQDLYATRHKNGGLCVEANYCDVN